MSKMNRKDLIKKYLEAETSFAEEQDLAESFVVTPPADEEEMAVCQLLQEVKPVRTETLPEAADEFDRIVRQTRRRTVRIWSMALSGVAAILVAVVFLARKPETIGPAEPESIDTLDLLRKIQFISDLDPADADGYEFKPVGDGFIMTAHFNDGREASYILTTIDSGQSFYLVSMND